MDTVTESVPAFVVGLRDSIVEAFDLVEADRAGGGALPLGPDGELGSYRLWTGDRVRRLVHVGVSLPDGSMDAHMLIAQTPAGTAVPHLGVDVMRFPDGFAEFVDLIPRVDLVAHRGYVERVYADLDPHYERFAAEPSARIVPMPPSMLAYYSPWMLHHMGLPTLELIADSIATYVTRFIELAADGLVGVDIPGSVELAARDRLHRGVLFDPDFDPVWRQVEPLLGTEAVTTIRETLASPLD
jgi:hypothetical protein